MCIRDSSYTGEDAAELQCHGSPVVLRAALEALFAAGARQAGPGAVSYTHLDVYKRQ